MRKAGLNLNRYQKSTDPSDLGAVCFRKIIHFWYFCSLVLDTASLALSGKREQKYQKWNIHSDFLAAKNTVHLWIGGFTGVLNKFTDLINLLTLVKTQIKLKKKTGTASLPVIHWKVNLLLEKNYKNKIYVVEFRWSIFRNLYLELCHVSECS